MRTFKMIRILQMLNDGMIEMETDLKVGSWIFIRWTRNNKREAIRIKLR